MSLRMSITLVLPAGMLGRGMSLAGRMRRVRRMCRGLRVCGLLGSVISLLGMGLYRRLRVLRLGVDC